MIAIKRVRAITNFKIVDLLSNSMTVGYFITPLLAAIVMPLIIKKQMGVDTVPLEVQLLLIRIVSLLNIAFVALSVPIMQIAEEKEKRTLRTLMVSGVSSMEFLLSNLFPIWLIAFLVQMGLVPLFCNSVTMGTLMIYGIVAALAILISCIIGLLLGIFAKNQTTAASIGMPVSMILVGISMYSRFGSALEFLDRFAYSSILTKGLAEMASMETVRFTISEIMTMIASLIFVTCLFLFLYKQNGFERD